MIPRTPSWRWDADTQALTLREAGIGPDAVTVTGPIAALLVDVLSWVHVLLEAARTLESVAEDLREEADR